MCFFSFSLFFLLSQSCCLLFFTHHKRPVRPHLTDTQAPCTRTPTEHSVKSFRHTNRRARLVVRQDISASSLPFHLFHPFVSICLLPWACVFCPPLLAISIYLSGYTFCTLFLFYRFRLTDFSPCRLRGCCTSRTSYVSFVWLSFTHGRAWSLRLRRPHQS